MEADCGVRVSVGQNVPKVGYYYSQLSQGWPGLGRSAPDSLRSLGPEAPPYGWSPGGVGSSVLTTLRSPTAAPPVGPQLGSPQLVGSALSIESAHLAPVGHPLPPVSLVLRRPNRSALHGVTDRILEIDLAAVTSSAHFDLARSRLTARHIHTDHALDVIRDAAALFLGGQLNARKQVLRDVNRQCLFLSRHTHLHYYNICLLYTSPSP